MDERSPESAQIVMIIFVISHSKADCERGFLINPNVTDGNMKKQSIRRKRLVRDHMQKHNLQSATIEITNVLRKYVVLLTNDTKRREKEKKKQQKNRLANQNSSG